VDTYTNIASINIFEDYKKFVKKYKVIIEAEKIFVDPYSLYKTEGKINSIDGSIYIRCYVRFKVNWKGNITDVNSLVFPGDWFAYENSNHLDGLKKGEYIDCMLDVPIYLNAGPRFNINEEGKIYSTEGFESNMQYAYINMGSIKSMNFLNSINHYKYSYMKTRQLKAVRKKRYDMNSYYWWWE
ncbi:MAG: hypothetical protein ACYDEX_21410, partial [Mobilitalea sp.]